VLEPQTMTVVQPRDSTIAVIGDGFGSLLVYATAVYLGFRPERITIFGPNESPIDTYQQSAYNLGQTVLRSESESHFLPADWPTFAQLDAWSTKSADPLVRTIRRKYNPAVSSILTLATVVEQRLRWSDSKMAKRIGWLRRELEPVPHFVMFDEDANYAGRAKHVMLALGHGPLSFPPVLAQALMDPKLADRIVQAYQPKLYATGGRYICVGAGIAAVNEWANALDAGASMLSLLRSPEPEEQDLNTPRCLFEAYGIDAFAGLSFEERMEFLGKILKGTTPKRRNWAQKVAEGRAQGRFQQLLGEIDAVEHGPEGLRVHMTARGGGDLGWLDVTGVVAATGFQKSSLTVPLLRRLVEYYRLPVEAGRIRLQTNCGVPGLDRTDSRLCMMGILANDVIPHGDTIAGLKYIARRFVADCARAENLKIRPLASRVKMQLNLAREAAHMISLLDPVEQLA
jgi:hypothetical protein